MTTKINLEKIVSSWIVEERLAVISRVMEEGIMDAAGMLQCEKVLALARHILLSVLAGLVIGSEGVHHHLGQGVFGQAAVLLLEDDDTHIQCAGRPFDDFLTGFPPENWV